MGETTVAVADLGRHDRTWLLSWERMTAVRAQGDVVCHGFGLPYPAPFSGAFVHEGRLWLQVGERRWPVDEIERVEQLCEGLRTAHYRLHLVTGSAEPVTIRVPLGVAVLRVLDPTYDEIVSWSEDVVKLLPYTAADGWTAGGEVAEWAARVLPAWEAGIVRPC